MSYSNEHDEQVLHNWFKQEQGKRDVLNKVSAAEKRERRMMVYAKLIAAVTILAVIYITVKGL